MDFELNEEQSMLREVSRTMLSANCTSELVRALAGSSKDLDEKLWQRGAELGWTGLAVPEELGGSGQGLVELCLVAEELGAAVAPGPVAETALAAMILARTAPHLDRVIAGLAEGVLKASWAVGEAGSHRLSPVHGATSADHVLVSMDVDGSPALVLLDVADLRPVARRTLDESRRWYDVPVADVAVAQHRILTRDPAEIRWAEDAATVLVAADALGIGQRLLLMTVEYVKVREQFGRPIGSFQAIKQKVANMAMTVKGVRAATYYAAMALDAGLPAASLATSVAKAHASTGISEVAGEALQAHGGIGFTWEHDLHLYLRRAKVDEVIQGDAAKHQSRVLEFHRIVGN